MLYTSPHLEISIPIHTIIYPLICSLRCYIRLRRGYCVSCETPLYMSYRLMTIGWIRIKMTAPPMRHNEGTQSGWRWVHGEKGVSWALIEMSRERSPSVIFPIHTRAFSSGMNWRGSGFISQPVFSAIPAIIIIALLEKFIRMSVKALARETVAIAQFVNFSRKNCSRPPT